MQYLPDANDEKMRKIESEFTDMKSKIADIKTMFKQIMVHNQNSSLDKMY